MSNPWCPPDVKRLWRAVGTVSLSATGLGPQVQGFCPVPLNRPPCRGAALFALYFALNDTIHLHVGVLFVDLEAVRLHFLLGGQQVEPHPLEGSLNELPRPVELWVLELFEDNQFLVDQLLVPLLTRLEASDQWVPCLNVFSCHVLESLDRCLVVKGLVAVTR